jgi:hypothetical protein
VAEFKTWTMEEIAKWDVGDCEMLMIDSRLPVPEMTAHVDMELRQKISNVHVMLNASGSGKTSTILDTLRTHYVI